jgi:hypothetical protein
MAIKNGGSMTDKRRHVLNMAYRKAIYKFRKNGISIPEFFLNKDGQIFVDYGAECWNWRTRVDELYDTLSINSEKYSNIIL